VLPSILTILHTLVNCKQGERHSFPLKTLQSVRGVFFFGAPHRGMHVDDIVEMATELSAEHRMHLINYLKKDSDQLLKDLSGFITLAGDFSIVSFYETVMSRGLVKAEAGDIDHHSIYMNLQ